MKVIHCCELCCCFCICYFFFNDTATTEFYTLSLHDALPISSSTLAGSGPSGSVAQAAAASSNAPRAAPDRKSTRLNSSHTVISYAVFCLKKKSTLESWCIARYGYLINY